jgi:hypothetical protein
VRRSAVGGRAGTAGRQLAAGWAWMGEAGGSWQAATGHDGGWARLSKACNSAMAKA